MGNDVSQAAFLQARALDLVGVQKLLQDGAFQGRIPEGSGTQYEVSGTNNEIRVRLNETLVRADRFYILPDIFL